ncbi:hypothetical protein N7510_009842 [Penicillium lagena]|uniref:uncharacterized protein n=1 Tax=Penicillium lagena TaxID=94218 RepID=UPI00254225AF|nr:uncharacterized protein N7510_009842 [Penicillium lagena]KAJ5604688.1 hypothetical protein N7510_009842 [Penicillium lagena]
MGVGDYIHSKEAGHSAAVRRTASLQTRQLRAEQAKVEVPATSLFELPPSNGDERTGFADPSQASLDHALQQRDAFDTDVEAVDDSTIAGTSIYGVDDNQSHIAPNANTASATHEPQSTYQPRHPQRSHGSAWYDGLGNKAMKEAGFDSEDAHDGDDGSQLTSSVGDDENVDEIRAGYYTHKPRAMEEPLSRRLENFWSASKRAPLKPLDPIPVNTAPQHQPRKLGQMLPPPGTRKPILPHSTSGTPRARSRFSPPKPSLLEQLDISPTRQGFQTSLQPERTLHMAALRPLEHEDHISDDGLDQRVAIDDRRDSVHSLNAFDITNLTDLDADNDDTIQDPFFTGSIRRRRDTIIHSKKRPFEADYPPAVLYQKSFSDLQAEPFDRAPSPVPLSSPVQSTPPQPQQQPQDISPDSESPKDAVSQLLKQTDQERHTFLSRMTVDEWEECGDQLLDRFSHLLSEMKNSRRVRRRMAAVFEREVKRRHDQVEEQNQELSTKLQEMRTGGAEVLRGRNA